MRVASFSLLLMLAACGASETPDPDAGPAADGATPRDAAAPSDGGPGDLGFLPNDGGVPDSGTGLDTGPSDASPPDASPPDANPLDAQAGVDSGPASATFTERLIDDQFRHGQGGEIIDIDGDGDQDAVIASSLSDTVFLYLNEGQGQQWARVPLAPTDTVVAMDTAVADFDGDGDQDVATVGLFTRLDGFGSPGEVTWFENTGDLRQGWVRRPISGLTVLWPFRVEAGDLTGDGRPDLVVTLGDPAGGAAGNGVRLYRWSGAGFAAVQVVDDTLLDVAGVMLTDVDGNGVIDIVAAGRGSDALVWYENQTPPGQSVNNPSFLRHSIATVPSPHFLGLANLDADPALELVASITRDNGAVVALDPPADPRQPWTESTVADDFGGGDARLALGDFDRDGQVDVAVCSMQVGVLRLYRRVNGLWTGSPLGDQFGVNWVLSGDFSGDGRPDLLSTTYERAADNDHVSWWENQP